MCIRDRESDVNLAILKVDQQVGNVLFLHPVRCSAVSGVRIIDCDYPEMVDRREQGNSTRLLVVRSQQRNSAGASHLSPLGVAELYNSFKQQLARYILHIPRAPQLRPPLTLP